jgi:hypothetical protein
MNKHIKIIFVLILLFFHLSGCIDSGVSDELKDWYDNHKLLVDKYTIDMVNLSGEKNDYDNLTDYYIDLAELQNRLLNYIKDSKEDLKQFTKPNDNLCKEYLYSYLYYLELSYDLIITHSNMKIEGNITVDEENELQSSIYTYIENSIHYKSLALQEMGYDENQFE